MDDSIIKVYATNWCLDCRRARRVLQRSNATYEWINIDQDVRAEAFVRQVNHGNRSVPTIIFPDGTILVEPSDDTLKGKLEELGFRVNE